VEATSTLKTHRWAILALTLAFVLASCGSEVPDEAQADIALQAGLNAHQAGDLTAAEGFYREALRYDPQNKFAYYNLGLIAHTQGDLAKAETDYRTAIGIDQNFAAALFNLALVRDTLEDPGEAESLYRQVITIEPGNAGAHLNLGLLLRRMGREAEGDAEVAIAQQIDPNIGPSAEPSAAPPDEP
jgi:tetratricopeptide (TPR) repeat protein